MYQNYNYINQQPSSVQMQRSVLPQTLTLKGRPVASLEEVRATGIDFDGSIFYFPDVANKRIYTKQINMDGTALLNVYELKELPPVDISIPQSNYVTREEFELAITQLRASMVEAPMQPEPVKPIEKQPLALNF